MVGELDLDRAPVLFTCKRGDVALLRVEYGLRLLDLPPASELAGEARMFSANLICS